MGLGLAQARSWLGKRPKDIPEPDREFIVLSRKAARRRKLRGRALIGVLAVPGLLVLLGVGYFVYEWARLLPWFWDVSTSVLTAEAERALKPGDTFMECASCPKMVVVPAGSFIMGSPANEAMRRNEEGPQHTVTIRQPLAVSKFELTFDEWDACAAHGGCTTQQFGRPGSGRDPARQVSWAEAKQYMDWIVKLTGKPYRLLTEAEWEYAARAGTTTAYFWGDEIGEGNANCTGCGSQWDGKIAPVGSFAANAFGLHDMHGNVWEWVEDCWHDSYAGNPPADGSVWTAGGKCNVRVVRGGSWFIDPRDLRSAGRGGIAAANRLGDLGFRVGRTLTP
jgi:formylglycine-generating enzyme required for sulfatase activity